MAADSESVGGHWEGRIEIPGQPLTVLVDLEHADGEWRGTVDIPAQGARGLALHRIKVGDKGEVEFTIRGVPGKPTFRGRLQDAAITGEFAQGGATFSFRLGREAAPGPHRPQEPAPPFPYASEKVSFRNGAVHLAGTLTVPAGEPPFPAMLLVTGSGAQNRDQEIFGHKPFLVIADHLARAGIAVLRVDDPGVGGSTPHPRPPTTADFAGDASAGVDFLLADGRFLGVGILGHSEGGLIAPLVASRRDDVAFAILLAAPGVPGVELMQRQNEMIYGATGTPEPTRSRLLGLIDRLFKALASDRDEDWVRSEVEAVVREQLSIGGVPTADREGQVGPAVEQTLTPWMRHFLRHDPGPALAACRVPVLAINGELDLQVDAGQNLPAITKALERAGNKDVTTRSLPGLNHLFQHAETGMVREYATIEQTIAPEVLNLIRDWVLARFAPST